MYKGNNVDGLTATGKRHWPPKVHHVIEKKAPEKQSSRARSSRSERESSSRRERRRVRKKAPTITLNDTDTNANPTTNANTNASTTVTPPNVGGCAGTPFGCCKDNTGNDTDIQKLGTDGNNCAPLPCGKFGCCLDGVTPRNDGTGSNCPTSECQNSTYGCCADNQTARKDAQGTNCEADSGGGTRNICNNPMDTVDVEFESLNGQKKQGQCVLLDTGEVKTLFCTFNNFC